MPQLTAEHIDFIIKDLHHRGLVLESLEDEVIDHVCSAVEEKTNKGVRFADAYNQVVEAFGDVSGLQATQRDTLRFENNKPKEMLKNYFVVAFRNLAKHRFYTLINVVGLAIGIAACTTITLFVLNELQYDKHHEKADRIHRVHGEIKFGGNHYRLAVAAAPMAEALRADYPEVESVVRFRNRGTYLIKREMSGDNIKEDKVIWADSTFFDIFTVPVLEGDPNTALVHPNSIAISRTVANKFFPNESALGKTLILDNEEPMKVTAVYEDMPATGHFDFNILIAMSGLEEAQSTNFLSNNFNTYVLLKEGADPEAFEDKLTGFIVKYVGPQAAQVLGSEFTMEKFEAAGNKYEFTLMPLSDIHLHSDLTAEIRPNGNITYVYLFSTIAGFILVIACINFMNLSTARSSNRAKEVGVRKVMGSLRSHLVRQFLTESILLTVASFFIAIAIAYGFLPMFNELVQKQLTLPLGEGRFYIVLVAAAITIGSLAGLYPSFFLSAFKPVNVLKGQVSLGMKSGIVRSALVVFQFVISIFLVIGTVTVYRQLYFIQHKKIGFQKDQVIIIQDAYALGGKAQTFKDEVKALSFIQNGTSSGFLPVDSWRSDQTYWPEGSQPTEETMVGIQTWGVDHNYVNTLGMQIKEGRFFDPAFPADSSAVVINEAAVSLFNFGDNPIGKKISSFSGELPSGAPDPGSMVSFSVVGVVEDFHFESLKENISPLGFFLRPNNGTVAFRFEAGDVQQVISTIESKWKVIAPGQPFQYTFLDEAFNRMYDNEQRLGKTFTVFAGLAIVIACLGLFALTAFTAEQRSKEIGIRKVLGASVGSIIVLLSREFGKLIVIAFVLAAPAAWFAVNWWLKNYTYKVEIGTAVYLLAGAFSFLIAWLTMGYQSIKAATANPVQSLRNE
jgi:putative ABC transport system permease protein